MPELVVSGPLESQQLRLALEKDRKLLLGRGDYADVTVPWDLLISRRHAEVCWEGEKLLVRQMDTGRNAIVYRGRECKQFELGIGEEFLIGKTRFRLSAPLPDAPEPPWPDDDSGMELLTHVSFQNPGRWLEVLSQLPETIAKSASDEQFAQSVVSMLLETLPRVDTAAVIQVPGLVSGTPSQLEILCWDSRQADQSRFQPSRKFVMESLRRQEGLVHIWDSEASPDDQSSGHFTNSGRFDWSFCVPITQEASWGWCLYMSGNLNCENMPIVQGRDELHEELKFAELLAEFVGALRELRLLERRQAGLNQFFSPAVRTILSNEKVESALRARQCSISVLFCGFRRPAEARQRSQLADLSKTVDESFRLMSESIFEQDGVMADFQGESAMAFWGWPVPSSEGPLPACKAALALCRAQRHNPRLSHARLICGIAHGPGIAGRIGPDTQCKVGAFGHVVNLGARLKSLARQMRAAVLLDSTAGEYVRQYLPPTEGRLRKIGQFRPRGMEQASAVYELLLPIEEDPTISEQHLADFEGAVDLIAQGHWDEARSLLDSLPADDACKQFLILMIAQNGYAPPPRWDGIFSLLSK